MICAPASNVIFVHREYLVGIGLGCQPAPDILVERDATTPDFSAHATIEQQYFTLLQAFGQATHGSFIISM